MVVVTAYLFLTVHWCVGSGAACGWDMSMIYTMKEPPAKLHCSEPVTDMVNERSSCCWAAIACEVAGAGASVTDHFHLRKNFCA